MLVVSAENHFGILRVFMLGISGFFMYSKLNTFSIRIDFDIGAGLEFTNKQYAKKCLDFHAIEIKKMLSIILYSKINKGLTNSKRSKSLIVFKML